MVSRTPDKRPIVAVLPSVNRGWRTDFLNHLAACSFAMQNVEPNLQAASEPNPRTVLLLGATLAMATHVLFWPTQAPDIDFYLVPWYEHIRKHGIVEAFGHPFSNYTPPYLYLLALASLTAPFLEPFHAIKALSVAGTGFLAFALTNLLQAAGARRPIPSGLAVFLLPTATLNSALLGQCDALWTAACLLAVAGALEGRLTKMLVWAGVAVAFKAQAAFLAPFLFAVLIRNRASPHLWLVPPAVYVAAMAPAWLAGWPAMDLLLVYPRQSVELADFIGNAANPWIFARVYLPPESAMKLVPIGLAAGAIAAVTLVRHLPSRLGDRRLLLLGALLSALVMPWLLPKMHERFFLLADVLALALALTDRDRPAVLLAAAVQVASCLAMLTYVTANPLFAIVGAVLNGCAILVTLSMIRQGARQQGGVSGTALLHAPPTPQLKAA